MNISIKRLLTCCLLSLAMHGLAHGKDLSSSVTYRPSELTPDNLAVVYNQNDANSTEVATYYAAARGVPKQNMVAVSITDWQQNGMSVEAFTALKATIEAKLGDHIQAVLMVWTTPFAVGCNSITSAYTLGYDEKQCQNLCGTGTASPYFNSRSLQPRRDLNIRPSMLLPTQSVEEAKALIDRGVLSGFSLNEATGYFVKTNDVARSRPRERFFPADFSTVESRKLYLRSPKAEFIRHKQDVMFYFTGQVTVQHLNTLTFLPGAIGDHLTSHGGIITSSGKDSQMNANAWLKAGATGSFGTVTEPCNYWQKFPNPQVLLSHYLAGETLIEAYWKSVLWPAQGLFVGEPLAAPYKQKSLAPLGIDLKLSE